MPSERPVVRETDLYAPVKRFLEERGYEVRGEVHGCDVVAVRGEDMVVVELKTSMNLALVLQGIDRLELTDLVYLAVPAPRRAQLARWPETIRLCRRLGLGLLTVRPKARVGCGVDVVADPVPYKPRPAKARRQRVLGEFARRSGDHNVGGSSREPRVTAYREEALLVAAELRTAGALRVRDVRRATGCLRAGDILSRNYYGWFARESPGVYGLTPDGAEALERFRGVLEAAAAPPARGDGRS
jgi:hypothetical protein